MTIKSIIRTAVDRYKRTKVNVVRRELFAKIENILSVETPPDTLVSEREFETLQNSYPSTRGDLYRYDDLSLFIRAVRRAVTVLRLPGMAEHGKTILDIGAGDGVLGAILSSYGHKVVLCDASDWRSRLGRSVDFQLADITKGIPFDSASFDLVVSYNSFEHFPDPRNAFQESLRVTKPSGMLHFDFGPLYCSPWGMHAYRSLYMPYSQFLFSEDFIREKLNAIGIRDLGTEKSELQFMNRWKFAQFNELWEDASCSVSALGGHVDERHLNLVLKFPKAFRGRGLTVDDLTKSSIAMSITKSQEIRVYPS